MKSLEVESGNAWERSVRGADGQPNGWFMGSSRFIVEPSLRQSEHCELKWSQFQKGFDSGPKPCSPFKGISILISGKFAILFRNSKDEPWQEHRMEKTGDFIISHGGLEHISRALEDAVLLTVRLTISESTTDT